MGPAFEGWGEGVNFVFLTFMKALGWGWGEALCYFLELSSPMARIYVLYGF